MSEQEQEKQTSERQEVKSPEGHTDARAADTKSITAHKRKKHKAVNLNLPLFVLLIILLAAGGWYALQYVKTYQQQMTALAAHQAELQKQNNSLRNEFSSKWNILKQQQDDLSNHITTLREKNQHLRKDWLLLEAEYLVQLANYRLLFERDINTAIAALNSADARLRDTGDPGVIRVRQVISEATQSLKQVPQSDLAGLSLTLSTLYKDIEKLPLNTPDPKSKEHQEKLEAAESPNVKSWQELPAAIWRDLKSLVVIRNHETPVQPLLSPEQRFFLVENLRLQIEQARLAMLTGNEKVYKERIETVMRWIGQHFDQESSITKAMLGSLQQLSTVAIAPELPDISFTYQALQTYRLSVTGVQVKPQATPEKTPQAK